MVALPSKSRYNRRKEWSDTVFYYEGLSCPVCSKVFTENDDVVVCPQCGLPHHRDCWKSIGRCYEEDKHGTEQQWSRARVHSAPTPPATESATRTCPHCNTKNAEYAEFCNRCGCPLETEDWHSSATQQYRPYVGEYTPYGQPQESYSSAERIGESNAADLAAVVGTNTQYYMERFRRIEHGGSGGWNWAAFLLGPMWLFYRKQYGLGTVFLLLQLMSNVVSSVIYAPVQLAETQAAAEAALMDLAGTPMFWLAAVLSAIFFALAILLGLRANYFYLHHCERKIAKARANVADLSIAELTAVGGVSFLIALLVNVFASILLDVITALITTFLS